MKVFDIYNDIELTTKAKDLYKEERESHKVLNGWFLSKEIVTDFDLKTKETNLEIKASLELEEVIEKLPLSISDNQIFVGTQRDAFAASYALINPAFKVETFKGYCDPLEVYDYATPTKEVDEERIKKQRDAASKSPYVKALNEVYGKYEEYTGEVAFFIEQVTGHMIPDFRYALKHGIKGLITRIDERLDNDNLNEKKKSNLIAMKRSLNCCLKLAKRYQKIALEQLPYKDRKRQNELAFIIETLNNVPYNGAKTLYEAMQSYLLLWQVMCIEQSPNPFAFSVGNIDRVFEPYREHDNLSRKEAAALFKHFLVFFNVGERSWAISQNVLISGKDKYDNDWGYIR